MSNSIQDEMQSNTIMEQIEEILESGNFSIKEWLSNVNLQPFDGLHHTLNQTNDDNAKVLGMHWNTREDNFMLECI